MNRIHPLLVLAMVWGCEGDPANPPAGQMDMASPGSDGMPLLGGAAGGDGQGPSGGGAMASNAHNGGRSASTAPGLPGGGTSGGLTTPEGGAHESTGGVAVSAGGELASGGSSGLPVGGTTAHGGDHASGGQVSGVAGSDAPTGGEALHGGADIQMNGGVQVHDGTMAGAETPFPETCVDDEGQGCAAGHDAGGTPISVGGMMAGDHGPASEDGGTMTAGSDQTVLTGGAGGETVAAGSDQTVLTGGAGGETVAAGSDQTVLTGGAGGETMAAGSDWTLLVGGNQGASGAGGAGGAGGRGGDVGFGGALDAGGAGTFGGTHDVGGDPVFGGTHDVGGDPVLGGTHDVGGDPVFGGTHDAGGDEMFGGTHDVGGDEVFGGAHDAGGAMAEDGAFIRVVPAGYDRALRNPMKGLTTNGVTAHDWATLSHVYIRWNELEDDESHGLERIRQVTEAKFGWVASNNVKVIPRVFLHWSAEDQKYWPSDMTTDDYSSDQFQQRLTRLVARLGEVWNPDPRVAFIELGIFGKWGEHHSPAPEPAMQALAAEAFAAAFPHKLVSVRHAWNQFQGHGFGAYWDSFSHYDQMWPHGQSVYAMNQGDARYLTTYIGGETAYDWGGWETQPGIDPTDSVRDPIHRNFIINTIRWLHCTQLRWIHAYDASDPVARAGAEEVHRAMGYRFVLDEVGFTGRMVDDNLRVTISVRNEGAAPFYYDWPLAVALLHPVTHIPAWSATFESVDIRHWIGGEGWPSPEWSPVDHWSQFVAPDHWTDEALQWTQPPPQHPIDESFQVDLPDGQYILAIAILDPASGRPNLRFASSWYFTGGYHPVGLVSVGQGAGGPLPDDTLFGDPHLDESINYLP